MGVNDRTVSDSDLVWPTLTSTRGLSCWMAGLPLFYSNYLDTVQPSLASLWASGFGYISPQSLINSTQNLPVICNVLVSNAPQLLISFVYVSLNSLLTCLLTSREFANFSHKRSGLRVTAPSGKYQRSTFWLSLPYRFSIPLLGSSILLHWSLSQALFLAEVKVLNLDGTLDNSNTINCVGFSRLGLLMLLLAGAVMLLALLIPGCLRYPKGVPVVQTCSLAISAACHPLPDKKDEAMQLLKYGVIGIDEDGKERVGFSSSPVRPLMDGQCYV